jgi:superfamily I DNA/RNA helicase
MSHEESNHSEQLLLFPTKDFITLREIADGGMLVFGHAGSGKTSTASAQMAWSIEESASFGGLAITGLLPSVDEEA